MVPVSPCRQSWVEAWGLSNLSPYLGSLESLLPLSGPQMPSQTLPPATAHTQQPCRLPCRVSRWRLSCEVKVSACTWASRLCVAQGGCCPRQGTAWKLGRARLLSQGHTETSLCPTPTSHLSTGTMCCGGRLLLCPAVAV